MTDEALFFPSHFKRRLYLIIILAPFGCLAHLLMLVSPAFTYSNLSYFISIPYVLGSVMLGFFIIIVMGVYETLDITGFLTFFLMSWRV